MEPSQDGQTAVARTAAQAAAALAVDAPRVVALFGSAAAFLNGDGRGLPPNDIDLLLVSDFPPPRHLPGDVRFPVELHRLRVAELIEIATMLRYDTRPVALARLYANNLVRRHALRVIAACLLLGPQYRRFGIEQIEIDGLEDPRDYSCHRILHGRSWWQQVTAWARERRGPLRRWSDRVVGSDVFPG